MYTDCRTSQVQAIRDTRGDIVFFVGKHCLKLAQLGNPLGVAHRVALKVTGVVHAAENADRAGAGVGRVSASLEAFPAQLHKDALLWVHQFGFSWRDAEEGGIEHFDAVDYAAASHVGWIPANLGGYRGIDLVVVEERYGFAACTEVVPERFGIRRTRETPRHSDDGDRFP